MDQLTLRVANHFLQGYKYQPKETKQHKVERLTKIIRDATGISRGKAEDIADAIIRNREIERLSIQKDWPIEDGVIEGPSGTIKVEDVTKSVTTS